MNPDLLLCASQEENPPAYVFSVTQVAVRSLEEAMFHVYGNWKQTADDIASSQFIAWMRDSLKLPELANRAQSICSLASASERILAFFRLSEYCQEEEIARLKRGIVEWERRLEWEKLKEQGDYFMGCRKPDRAIEIYKKALGGEKRVSLLNNMAAAYMTLQRPAQAKECFKEALSVEPENRDLLENYIQCCISMRDFTEAREKLSSLRRLYPHFSGVSFLFGEMSFEEGNVALACDYYMQAISMNPNSGYIYRLCEACVAARQYSKAIDALSKARTKDAHYYKALADVHEASGNIPEAARTVELALKEMPKDAELWQRLSRFRRSMSQLEKASEAAANAIAAAPDDMRGRLEYARVKKASGKTLEYRDQLKKIIFDLKRNYRNEVEGAQIIEHAPQ
ncbi:MAG: tetratricopeptide repeat protein [Clostridiales bacterium]|jgi:tetratricopeptide (TPR) repeat protein|nr:tetratricopeptide repeat protein [Clostridiales bacterium]